MLRDGGRLPAPSLQEALYDRIARSDRTAARAARRGRLRQLGVRSLGLFGSAVRGEAHAGSDLDVLVEFEGPATFDRYFELKFLLEDVLGRRIDLVTRRALKPALRPYVERDLVHVA